MNRPRDIVKLRGWCIRRHGEGVSVSEICTAVQIPRRTFYNWWSRYENGGFDNLTDKPRKPNTIHRTPDETVKAVIGESGFDAYCEANSIRHILGGIGKPTTQGKIERWFRTYDQEHSRFQLHRKFIQYYNYERPHMTLNYSTPAEVYFADVPHVL